MDNKTADTTNAVRAILKRASVRAYKPDPFPQNILAEIIHASLRTPSGKNIQPWEITIVTGKVLENIRRVNIEKLDIGIMPYPDVCTEMPHGQYKDRSVAVAMQLYDSLNIRRDDMKARTEWQHAGSRYFDAPAVIFIASDRALSMEYTQFCIGALTQSICLAAIDYGLGTCIEIQGIIYPDVIRKYAGISDTRRIIISIAIGYPDWDAPANRFQSERVPAAELVNWQGFEQAH
jgi:nitroreductase